MRKQEAECQNRHRTSARTHINIKVSTCKHNKDVMGYWNYELHICTGIKI